MNARVTHLLSIAHVIGLNDLGKDQLFDRDTSKPGVITYFHANPHDLINFQSFVEVWQNIRLLFQNQFIYVLSKFDFQLLLRLLLLLKLGIY